MQSTVDLSNWHPTQCHGEQLHLHHEHAVLWQRRSTLFVADTHLGKEHAFGRAGLPIPAGSSDADLVRLSFLLRYSGAQRLVVLGDLFHARPVSSESWLTSLSRFLDQHQQLRVEVIAGNHDKPAGRGLVDSRVGWHEAAVVDAPFVLQHEPGTSSQGYVLCGHIHPAFRLGRGRKNSVRAPAFWFSDSALVLPSFGQFTGGHTIKPSQGDRVFLAGPECVVPVFGNSEPA